MLRNIKIRSSISLYNKMTEAAVQNLALCKKGYYAHQYSHQKLWIFIPLMLPTFISGKK